MTSPNTNPIFTDTANLAVAAISTANTARDGTGTVPTIFTAGVKGSRVHRIRVKATVTTTAGMVRIFVHNGSAFFLYLEVPVTAITPSATVESFSYELDLPNEDALILPTGYTIRASTHNAETFNVFVEGGDF